VRRAPGARVSCEEYRRNGAFADYVAVPARILYRLPDGLSFEQAALLETLSVAVHAVRRVGVSPGETAVVVGTGMVGLSSSRPCALTGATA